MYDSSGTQNQYVQARDIISGKGYKKKKKKSPWFQESLFEFKSSCLWCKIFNHSCVHSPNSYLLDIHYLPGIVRGVGRIVVNINKDKMMLWEYVQQLFGLFCDIWRLPKQMKFGQCSEGWVGVRRQNVRERYSRHKEQNLRRHQGWKKHDTFQ